jgi:hypothetical protein
MSEGREASSSPAGRIHRADSFASQGSTKESKALRTKAAPSSRRKLFILPARRGTEDTEVSPRTVSDSSQTTGDPSGSPNLSFMRRKSLFSPKSASSSISGDTRSPQTSDLTREEIEAIQRLEVLLASSEPRSELVATLLGEHRADLAMRLRFVSAVQELMRSEDTDREWVLRAKKIVNVFFDAKSNFKLDDLALPKTTVAEMQATSSASQLETLLMRAREKLMSDLIKTEQIRAHLLTSTTID